MEINSKSSLSVTPQGEAAWRTQSLPPSWRDLLAAARRGGGTVRVADVMAAVPDMEASALRIALSDMASRGWLLIAAEPAARPEAPAAPEAEAQPGSALEALLARTRATRGADRPAWAAPEVSPPQSPEDASGLADLEPAPAPATPPPRQAPPPAHPETQEDAAPPPHVVFLPASTEPVDVLASPEQDAIMLRAMGLVGGHAPPPPIAAPPPSPTGTATGAPPPPAASDPRQEEVLRRLRFDREQRELSRHAVRRERAREQVSQEAAEHRRASATTGVPKQDSVADVLAKVQKQQRDKEK